MGEKKSSAPLPGCCDPTAPYAECCVCGKPVHTCEAPNASGPGNHCCPTHGEGCELENGAWACCESHYDVACAISLLRDEGFGDDANAVAEFAHALSRRVAELEKRVEVQDMMLGNAKRHHEKAVARAEAAEAKCREAEEEAGNLRAKLELTREVNVKLRLRTTETEAKSARLGRKLQRVGLNLDETRKKLRKVEQENREKQGRIEAMEIVLRRIDECGALDLCHECRTMLESALAAREVK